MVKLTWDNLIEFYDAWILEHGVVDPEQKRRIWWAMFYACKEGREWIERRGSS